MTMPRAAALRALAVLVAVLAADQISKAMLRGSLDVGERHHVVGPLDLVHVRNTGIAFGAFSGGGVLVVVLVAAALLALLVYFARHARQPLVWLPTGLLLGGSLGNIIDRIRVDAVTDFIKVPHWPAFNLADIAITFGVVFLVWVLERGDRAADRRAG